jgi:hypothetical protein
MFPSAGNHLNMTPLPVGRSPLYLVMFLQVGTTPEPEKETIVFPPLSSRKMKILATGGFDLSWRV